MRMKSRSVVALIAIAVLAPAVAAGEPSEFAAVRPAEFKTAPKAVARPTGGRAGGVQGVWKAPAGVESSISNVGARKSITSTEPPLEEVSFVFHTINVPYSSGRLYTARDCMMDGGTVLKKSGRDTCRIPRRSRSTTASSASPGSLPDLDANANAVAIAHAAHPVSPGGCVLRPGLPCDAAPAAATTSTGAPTRAGSNGGVTHEDTWDANR